MSFEGAEIDIYYTDKQGVGRTAVYELSPTQIKVAFTALGFNLSADKSYTCYGENTLNKILRGKINPFTVKQTDMDR